MKTFVKQYYQEYVDNINFPTIIFIYETGKVAALNKQALEMIGKSIKNIKKILQNNPNLSIPESILTNGNCTLYNQRLWTSNDISIEIDCELNSICVDELHLIVLFFDYSFKQLFIRSNKYMLPRIFWVNKQRCLMGCNETFRNDINCSETETLPNRIDDVVDEDSSEKISEDCGKVLLSKEPLYNMLQLIKPNNKLGFFCKINRIPLFNKNGTVVGVMSVYTLIFNREEYERFYTDAMRENNILNKIICMTDTIVISFKKEIEYTVEYVSSNVSSLGYTVDEWYRGKVKILEMISDAARDTFLENVHNIEYGTEDYFNQIVQVRKADQSYVWMNLYICISKRNSHVNYYECFLQKIAEQKFSNGKEAVPDLTLPYRKMDMDKAIQERLTNIHTYYQMIIDPLTMNMIGLNSVLCYKSDKYGIVDPKEVLTASEYMTMLKPLTEQYIRSAFAAFVKMKKVYKSDIFVQLSVSSLQLVQADFMQCLKRLTKEAGINPKDIIIEVNESLMIESNKFLEDILTELKAQGYRVSLIYYGAAGGSDLNRILALPLDMVKLDKEAMYKWQSKEIEPNRFIEIIDYINHSGILVIVKGVETKQQLEYLMFQDIYALQGNYFGIPLNQENMVKRIKEMNV